MNTAKTTEKIISVKPNPLEVLELNKIKNARAIIKNKAPTMMVDHSIGNFFLTSSFFFITLKRKDKFKNCLLVNFKNHR